MKAGDLVKVKNPAYPMSRMEDEKEAREAYPWKFEVGIVTCNEPRGSFPGKEVYVHFPSYPEKTILCSALEVVSESR